MLRLSLSPDRHPLRILCLGAHSDDIEIGCAGTLLRWLSEQTDMDITLAVFSGSGDRGQETLQSARSLFGDLVPWRLTQGDLDDSYFPAQFSRAKAFAHSLRTHVEPDLVLTHSLADAHQDHRLVAELTWQTWRHQLILEYEIPKYDDDLGNPNLFVPLSEEIAHRKVDHLMRHFATQTSKDWFRAETFTSLMRLRAVQCRSDSGWAEAFYARKVAL